MKRRPRFALLVTVAGVLAAAAACGHQDVATVSPSEVNGAPTSGNNTSAAAPASPRVAPRSVTLGPGVVDPSANGATDTWNTAGATSAGAAVPDNASMGARTYYGPNVAPGTAGGTDTGAFQFAPGAPNPPPTLHGGTTGSGTLRGGSGTPTSTPETRGSR